MSFLGLTGGTLVGKYGRKFGMYIITVLFAFGYLLLVAAYHKSMLFIGKFTSFAFISKSTSHILKFQVDCSVGMELD